MESVPAAVCIARAIPPLPAHYGQSQDCYNMLRMEAGVEHLHERSPKASGERTDFTCYEETIAN